MHHVILIHGLVLVASASGSHLPVARGHSWRPTYLSFLLRVLQPQLAPSLCPVLTVVSCCGDQSRSRSGVAPITSCFPQPCRPFVFVCQLLLRQPPPLLFIPLRLPARPHPPQPLTTICGGAATNASSLTTNLSVVVTPSGVAVVGSSGTRSATAIFLPPP